MGVKGLFPFLKKKVPEAFREINLKDEYKSIVLDANLAMHRYARSQGGDWTKGILYQIRTLLEIDILPIYILDGKPPQEKMATLDERRELRKKAEKEDDGSFESKCRCFKVDKNEEEKFTKWCNMIGIPVIKAEGEADPLLVTVLKDGYVDAVWSEDGDILGFGCSKLIRKWKRYKAEEIDLSVVLKGLDLTMEQFQKFIICLGTDYAKRAYGPATALKKVKRDDFKLPSIDHENALRVFNTLPPLDKKISLKRGRVDENIYDELEKNNYSTGWMSRFEFIITKNE